MGRAGAGVGDVVLLHRRRVERVPGGDDLIYRITMLSKRLGALVRHETVEALSVVGCGVALSGAYVAARQRS